MSTAVRETRAPHELAQQRAAADAVVNPDEQEREYRRGVLAAFDWLEGHAVCAPVTGDPVGPDWDAVHDERVRAEEAEALALSKGLDGTFPGAAGLALSWFQRRTFTEAPY